MAVDKLFLFCQKFTDRQQFKNMLTPCYPTTKLTETVLIITFKKCIVLTNYNIEKNSMTKISVAVVHFNAFFFPYFKKRFKGQNV